MGTRAKKSPENRLGLSLPSSPTIYRCNDCTKGFLSADKRDQHTCLKIPTSSSKRANDAGGQQSQNPSEKQLASDNPASPTIYRCIHCTKGFFSADKRDQHVCPKNPPRASINSNPNMGPRAKKSPENRLGLSLPSSPTIYRCNDCTKGFLSADKRDQHTCLKIPTSPSRRANDARGQQSKRPSEASDTPASPTIYRCKHCTKGFLSEDNRDQHHCHQSL
ncbi:hypothetical protein EGW08_009883 [Elysia chlorotica]|uniref:Uncharacterized protein n=1 Tax=Elysia chlorotica TaxID=188477 RepID=A0A3S0ZP02_ELYCH|nr:hypothetical protein EGW08_009883 [Elysia chlorotica]